MRISDWSSDVCSSDLIGGGTVLWGDAEPKGIKGGKEEKGKHRPDYNAPDQHDGQFSPECLKRQWGEGQHCGQSRQKHRAGAMKSGLDNGIAIIDPRQFVLSDLVHEDQGVPPQNAVKANQTEHCGKDERPTSN